MPDLPDTRRKWQSIGQFWPILAAASLGLAVAVSAWLAVSVWEERLAKAKFNDIAGDYGTVLQTGLDEYLGKLVAVRAFYDSSVEVDPGEFSRFTDQILDGSTGKMRVIWAPYVSGEERAAFEQKIGKAEPGYVIKTWAMTGPSSPAPERDEYFPVLYSTFATKAPATLGMDLNSEPARSRAIQRARDGDVMATAQNLQLRNPIGGVRPGFIVMVPVYRSGARLETLVERHDNILGVIVGAFQTHAVVDAILAMATLPQNVTLYLYPADANAEAMPLYARAPPGESTEPKSEADLAGLPYWSGPVKVGDAHWNLVVVPVKAGLIGYYRAWLVRACVVLVFAALLTYMWASLRHALRLETANSKILELAQTDLLTNLANRRAFTKRLTMAFNASLRGAPPFAVLYLDVDDFKDVNDTLGHAMGDLLLKAVVARLKHTIREEDFVARFGGDEFTVLVMEVTDPAIAASLAERIGKALAEPFMIGNHKLRITSSIGITLFTSEAPGPEAMMVQADLALYGAKDEGRNCYRFHSRDLDQRVHERVRVAEELRAALDHGELELFYQPQVELATGRITGL